MRKGDIVEYKYPSSFPGQRYPVFEIYTGMILQLNEEGGTLKVLDSCGKVAWFVTSHCRVIS